MSTKQSRIFGHRPGAHGAEEVIRPTLISFWPFLIAALAGSYLMRVVTPHTWFPLIVPVLILLEMTRRLFDTVLVLGRHRIFCIRGRLSLRIRRPTIRYTDIRGVWVRQGIAGRLFDYGKIEISTAGTDQVEISISGIASPRLIARYLDQKRMVSGAEGSEIKLQ